MTKLSELKGKTANILPLGSGAASDGHSVAMTQSPTDPRSHKKIMVTQDMAKTEIDPLRHSTIDQGARPREDRSARQVQPRRQQRTVVVVGCDFGTHSTKVLFQRRGEDRIRLAKVCDSCAGYPACATPSLLRVVGERLYFGTRAALRRDGTPLSSLKVDLLRATDDGPINPERDSEVLVTAYLSWVFAHVRKRVLSEYTDANVLIQIAAPIDYKGFLKHSIIRRRFQMVAQAAWRVVFDGCGGNLDWLQDSVPYGPACERIRELLLEQPLNESEARFQVLPETVAPVVSLALDPEMEPGIFLMVDTGAGTTEMSVVLATQSRDGDVATCYFDSTIEIGGDKFQHADETGNHQLLGALVRQLENQARTVHHTSFQKDMRNRTARGAWKDLSIILTGGGTKRSEVANAFHASHDTPLSNYFNQFGIKPFVLDGPRISLDTVALGVAPEEARYLVVARGLLVERTQWPFTFLPDEVEPLQSDGVIERPQQHWDDR